MASQLQLHTLMRSDASFARIALRPRIIFAWVRGRLCVLYKCMNARTCSSQANGLRGA